MRLSKLIAETGEEYAVEYGDGSWDREITSLSADSRRVGAGGLFFCLEGSNSDGHQFAVAAVKNGAAAVVATRKTDVCVPQIIVKDTRKAFALFSSAFYGKPAERLKVIAVTGTNGKTSVSYMLEKILQKAGKNVGVIGTLGVRYNGVTYPSELTTPDPVFLHKTFTKMFLHGVEYVVMEASAHALWYEKTAGIPFIVCIFTNLTQDHLDFFKTMQTYGEAKAKLFTKSVCPLAILNGDEPFARSLGAKRERSGGKTVYYGLTTPAEAFALITDESLCGSECMLNVNDRLLRVSLRLAGLHNVYNALAAATCAIELGIPQECVMDGLNTFEGVKGRMQHVGDYQGGHMYVDFAHTPDGLKKSLETLKKHCKGRLICLFGCGGNRDKSKRPIMGETAAKFSDFCVLTSDNPRYEDPLDILSDIEKGYRRFSTKYVVVPDRKKALSYAVEQLQKEDVLLVAGKGGEEYQEIMGIKYAFDDQDILKKICNEKGDKLL